MSAKKEGKGTGGKRLVSKKAKRRGGAVVLALLLLAAGGYFGLCVYAGTGSDSFAPNSTALGVDVSGLTQAQAEEAVKAQLTQALAGKSILLREPVSGASAALDVSDAVDRVGLSLQSDLRETPLPLRGAKFVQSLFSDRDVLDTCYVTDGWKARYETALEDLSRAAGVTGSATTYTVEEEAVSFRKGVTGRAVDLDDLWDEVNGGLTALATGETDQAVLELQITDSPPADPDLEKVRGEILTQVADAYFDPETREIVPAVTGKDLDVALAGERLAQTEEGQVCRVPLTITEPELTTEDLTAKLFKDTLAQAATKVTGTSIRVENVRHAAAFVNEKVVMPGEEFSFNQTCSPYTVGNGYGKATAYVGGLSKDTVAGGICQMSSTLYWASLKANLETVERYAHAYYPSYITGGLDATVYGDYGTSGSLDFRFKNSTEYPIKLTAYIDKDRYLHVSILGTDTTGIHGEPYSTNKVVTKTAQTIYEAREDIPQGTTQKDPERTAYNGANIDTYQKLVDKEGNVVEERKLYTSKYAVRNAVIWYNPADAALWGIDPATGLKTLEPQTPAPDGSAAPTESGAPVETAVPSASTAPVESTVPVEPSAPAVTQTPVETPAPVEPTAEPQPAVPSVEPDQPLPPPEAVVLPPEEETVPVMTPPAADLGVPAGD